MWGCEGCGVVLLKARDHWEIYLEKIIGSSYKYSLFYSGLYLTVLKGVLNR